MGPNNRSAYEERRQRMEKILEEKRKRLVESQDKKKFEDVVKNSIDKDKRIKILEEKVDAMEKIINQLKLDFSRYRARNPSKGTKGIKG
jgi:hypothetical protein